MERLSAAQARRLALAAAGFGRGRPTGRVDVRHVRRVVGTTHLLQIDSVNVLARAHYVPLFSRLGPYAMETLDDLAYERRELFEYWGHEACLLPMRLYPWFRFRREEVHPRWQRWVAEHRTIVDAVLGEITERGALGVSDLEEGGARTGPWWGWSDGKVALEYLFLTGRITTATRRGFERIYDLPERVIPPEHIDGQRPSVRECYEHLLVLSAGAQGVATARDLTSYFRLHGPTAKPILADLVDDGRLEPVEVEGWRQAGFALPGTRPPRRIDVRALVSPFDPLIFERQRPERIFGFDYRIEIYVPAPKRRYGYYVLPFLLDDRFVARVDLKADRAAGTLLVQSAHAEEGVDHAEVAEALAGELAVLARWLELDGVEVRPVGDLATALAGACHP